MAREIVWTPRAEKKFSAICEYIELNWGKHSVNKYATAVYRIVELIGRFPEMGSMEVKEKNIRGIVITKQTKLFYCAEQYRIVLLTLFDTRQNPSKKFIELS